MMVDIPECPYCTGLIFFNQSSVEMADGELWHEGCSITHNGRHTIKCRHPKQPGQSHLNLPCAWPDCSEGHDGNEFYLPLPDFLQQFICDPNPVVPERPRQATYKRITLHVEPWAQKLYNQWPQIHRWVRQP